MGKGRGKRELSRRGKGKGEKERKVDSRRSLRLILRRIEIDIGLDLLRYRSLVVRDRWCSRFDSREKEEVVSEREREGRRTRRARSINSRSFRPSNRPRNSVGSLLHEDHIVRGGIPGTKRRKREKKKKSVSLSRKRDGKREERNDSPILRPRCILLLPLPLLRRLDRLLLRFRGLVEE